MSVVLTVVALAATLVWPRLGDPGALRVAAAARRLAEAVTLARDGAILGGAPGRLVLDLDRGRWTTGDESASLPEGIRFRAVSAAGAPPVAAGLVTVDLAPEGDPLAARFDLADRQGRAASVVVPPVAGRATVILP